jgi:hypothetical protein
MSPHLADKQYCWQVMLAPHAVAFQDSVPQRCHGCARISQEIKLIGLLAAA